MEESLQLWPLIGRAGPRAGVLRWRGLAMAAPMAAPMAARMAPMLALAADPQITSFIDAPDPVPACGIYTYSLRVDNNLADAALNTRLQVTVPAGATYLSSSPAAANCVPLSATTAAPLCKRR